MSDANMPSVFMQHPWPFDPVSPMFNAVTPEVTIPDAITPSVSTHERTSSAQPKCTCNHEVQSDSPELRFGHVYALVCFKHGVITPQAAKWLATLPGCVYPSGTVGLSKAGKSCLNNCKVEQRYASYITHFNGDATAAAEAAGVPFLPTNSTLLRKFVESAQADAQTMGIDAIAVPRYRAGSTEMDTELIIDAEGLQLGNTVDHDAVLGILSRIVTHLTFVQQSSFNYNVLNVLGRLVASKLIVSGIAAPWPYLHLLINKRSLEPPADEMAFITQQLTNNPNDPTNNADRDTVRRTWADQGRLMFSSIPLDMAITVPINLGPQAWQQMSAETQKLWRAPFVSAVAAWTNATYHHTTPFTWRYAAAASGEHVDGRQAPVSGEQYAQFIDTLVRAYAAAPDIGPCIDPLGAVETFVRAAAEKAVGTAKAHYEAEKATAPHLLNKGNNDVDGARGTPDDAEASTVLLAVQARHATLAELCQKMLDTELGAFTNLGPRVDSVLQRAKEKLTKSLATQLIELNDHWQLMRSIVSSRVDHRTRDGEPFTEFHHKEEDHSTILGIIHLQDKSRYYWAKYVYRRDETRVASARRNGDVVHGTWTTSTEVKVNVGGPWQGLKDCPYPTMINMIIPGMIIPGLIPGWTVPICL